MRIVVAECSVDYSGRLNAHLPKARRVLMLKGDGSVLIHSDGGSYKPLNWMSAPCSVIVKNLSKDELEAGICEIWQVAHHKTGDQLNIVIFDFLSDTSFDLGIDPGLIKDGVESDLQKMLAEQINILGDDFSLIRREYYTAIGPVDILAKDSNGNHYAIEIKRKGEIDGVEQLSRYLELLNRNPNLAPVIGIFAAQDIKPQAKTLAADRKIRCVVLDYEAMKGKKDVNALF